MLRKKDQTVFSSYLEDNSGLKIGFADEIVYPENEEELVDFIKELNQGKVTCTISGAGTGVVGGRIPQGGSILATDKLNKIIDIEKNNCDSGIAIIEPGVSIAQLSEEIRGQGLAYLPDPTENNAFIGGTIATNASGACGFKYGPTRNYVQGLRVVLAGGEILDINRNEYILKNVLRLPGKNFKCALPTYTLPQIKNSAGYFAGVGTDLIDLFIGQEGTLGVITQARVLLKGLPEENFSGVVFFDKNEQALEFVYELKKQSFFSRINNQDNSIDAACIEYFDDKSLLLLGLRYQQIPKKKAAAIYFQQNIAKEQELCFLEKYEKLFTAMQIKAGKVWFAQEPADKALISALRHDLPELINEQLRHNGFSKISTDIAVPEKNFLELFDYYQMQVSKHNIAYCLFGHIGENHLHLNFIPKNKSEFEKAKQLYREIINKAIGLNGTVAAEHGIGKIKREYLKLMLGEKGLREMASLKRCLDPDLMLGPGNIFDPVFLSEGSKF